MAPGVEKAGNHALREERELSVDITQDEVRAWVLGLEKYGMDYLKQPMSRVCLTTEAITTSVNPCD